MTELTILVPDDLLDALRTRFLSATEMQILTGLAIAALPAPPLEPGTRVRHVSGTEALGTVLCSTSSHVWVQWDDSGAPATSLAESVVKA